MRNIYLLAAAVSMCFGVTFEASGAETIAAKRYSKLIGEYEEDGNPRAFSSKFIELAQQHPRDDAAVKALLWVVDNVRGKRDTHKALAILAERHANSKLIGAATASIAQARSVGAAKLLRAVYENGSSETNRTLAGYQLAKLMDAELAILSQLKAEPELAPRVLQYYGKEYGAHLQSLKRDEVVANREKILAKLVNSKSEIKIDDEPVRRLAERDLFAIQRLSVGSVAPDIVGKDIGGDPLKLSSFRGKIVMLTFWGHW